MYTCKCTPRFVYISKETFEAHKTSKVHTDWVAAKSECFMKKLFGTSLGVPIDLFML